MRRAGAPPSRVKPGALLDTNVLVHALYSGSPLHRPAAGLVDLGLKQRGRYCVAPQNLIEFAAVVTRARFVDPPLDSRQAAKVAERLYRSRCLTKIYPSRGTVERALREGRALGAKGPLWYDLFLAITMREAGVTEIITENAKDFGRFPFLTVKKIQEAL